MPKEPGTQSSEEDQKPAPWIVVWVALLTRPSVATFERHTRGPGATSRKACIWLLVAGFIEYAFYVRGYVGMGMYMAVPFGPRVLLLALLYGIFKAILVLSGAGLTGSAAEQFGGCGSYPHLAYAFAACAAPLTLISKALERHHFHFLIGCAPLAYGVILCVIAVKAVHRVSWPKALASTIMGMMVWSVFAFGLGLLHARIAYSLLGY